MGDGAEASIDAKLVLPRIGFGAALRGTELVLNYRDQPCGRLTAREPILLGDGGEARFQLHGALSVRKPCGAVPRRPRGGWGVVVVPRRGPEPGRR